jgi:uncharacterized protein YjbI with pentapeptide repeats
MHTRLCLRCRPTSGSITPYRRDRQHANLTKIDLEIADLTVVGLSGANLTGATSARPT